MHNQFAQINGHQTIALEQYWSNDLRGYAEPNPGILVNFHQQKIRQITAELPNDAGD